MLWITKVLRVDGQRKRHTEALVRLPQRPG
jgi:hypothetical protein